MYNAVLPYMLKIKFNYFFLFGAKLLDFGVLS